MIKETQNNEINLEKHIKEINQKQDYNMNEIFNKLNEFKKQQTFINEKNLKEIDQLTIGISKQIEELENIKRSLRDENANNRIIIEQRIDKLEKEINEWMEFSKKMDELMLKNMEESNNKLIEINKQVDNFKQNVSEKLKETKKYIDSVLENYSRN